MAAGFFFTSWLSLLIQKLRSRSPAGSSPVLCCWRSLCFCECFGSFLLSKIKTRAEPECKQAFEYFCYLLLTKTRSSPAQVVLLRLFHSLRVVGSGLGSSSEVMMRGGGSSPWGCSSAGIPVLALAACPWAAHHGVCVLAHLLRGPERSHSRPQLPGPE